MAIGTSLMHASRQRETSCVGIITTTVALVSAYKFAPDYPERKQAKAIQ